MMHAPYRMDSPTSSEVQFDEAPELILVTTYTNTEKLAHTPKCGDGEGIYAFDLNPTTGALTKRGSLAMTPNPAFLVKHPNLPRIYGTTECIDQAGEIFTLNIDPTADAGVSFSGRVQAGGKSTCYINISEKTSQLVAVNYWDAKVCTLPLDNSGAVSEVSHTHAQPGSEYVDMHNPDRLEHWEYRQRWPHTHCAVTEPYSGEERVFVCDLAKDCVEHFKLQPGGMQHTGTVQLQAGLGPRHCIFHPRQKACYIVNELTSSVSFLRFNDKALDGQVEDSLTPGSVLEHVRTISTLPVDWQDKQTIKNGVWKAASHCSEIRIHPSGKLLFVGNRGHDSLAIFKINEEAGGDIELGSIVPSGGACPRNFNFSATGQWVIVGNQDSSNVTVFEADIERGTMAKACVHDCPAPNFVYAVPAEPMVRVSSQGC
eukprot:CAMPEP_0206229056 /NCGR_PEP_ID=MMETSP0047_2-20121206/9492_1 /ASSEMBLY_ACC=CAM_ASM_000192 /TAXON_ID=195065 /ORGANISM="Chroomonas mesostigmatica_cf, Strain CCMP1168" /LENGTH=427 /DNA_ID=CAMNT_0053652327 /DNA_START=59 /DNA_END=1342 /DNA_ORIENTATION=+